MISLEGIYPPITTPIKDGEISYNDLVFNLKKWNEFNLSGYVILGSNGENVMLSDEEGIQLIETAVKYLPPDKQLIIGAGKESTEKTLRFINKANIPGASAALVINPHYYKDQMRERNLQHHFLTIAEGSPLPLILYNVPKFTGKEIPAALVIKLAEHPNIIGIKDSSGNLAYQQSILAASPEDFYLLSGSASTLMASLMAGARGGILALANIAPQICVDLYKHVREGNIDEARSLQKKIIRLNQLTTNKYGIGGLKFAMDQTGFYGGIPFAPLVLPDDAGKKEILTELIKVTRKSE